ncbi:pilus assembly PilX N-terminal domain-containing protein [Desulfoluna sp.]|uniref:pilus assembly PilX family protein n=1 Tax=Desulfoluna sp. TaxID=2045199 RepID=UPI002608E706|nr:pilus assembly PilX N-terminal domain-containing protein [Desulfoluna sp.]
MSANVSNEKGYVMLFTLMFILIITVMGLIATQTSVFEIKIAENSRRYSEELAGAEAALNDSIANFRSQSKVGTTYDIAHVLNDTKYRDFKTAFYINDSPQDFPLDSPGTSSSIALIEIRRIVDETEPTCSGNGSDPAFCTLSEPARTVPRLPHRYYAGSIDKRRFAVTATSYRRNSTNLSVTWVQKGISLPAEQNADLF